MLKEKSMCVHLHNSHEDVRDGEKKWKAIKGIKKKKNNPPKIAASVKFAFPMIS